MHIIGEILGATGFARNGLQCTWACVADATHWRLAEGVTGGRTQIDASHRNGSAVWNHPIDMAFSTASLEGWPKLRFEVTYQDLFYRNIAGGYGAIFVPMAPGTHEVDCAIWRPKWDAVSDLRSWFIEDHPTLTSTNILTDESSRFGLTTESTGRVYVRLSVITSGFDQGAIVELGAVDVAEQERRRRRAQRAPLEWVNVPDFDSDGIVPLADPVGGKLGRDGQLVMSS